MQAACWRTSIYLAVISVSSAKQSVMQMR